MRSDVIRITEKRDNDVLVHPDGPRIGIRNDRVSVGNGSGHVVFGTRNDRVSVGNGSGHVVFGTRNDRVSVGSGSGHIVFGTMSVRPSTEVNNAVINPLGDITNRPPKRSINRTFIRSTKSRYGSEN